MKLLKIHKNGSRQAQSTQIICSRTKSDTAILLESGCFYFRGGEWVVIKVVVGYI
ncbi:MAG: hypothetical protein LBL39_04880 [Planctomycetaceae bacterium]|nr:hypothetical protein [Planctomycetaceae bacterium]